MLLPQPKLTNNTKSLGPATRGAFCLYAIHVNTTSTPDPKNCTRAHTVRGAISGQLKKKLGLNVTSEKDDQRGRVYRLPID
ncbi:DUF3489 domain-containing protein [Rhodobacteraceae bacterium F11138]|nr:DUF3489 domain-containing protein [Rhodobacteraceae bacterium F11138]